MQDQLVSLHNFRLSGAHNLIVGCSAWVWCRSYMQNVALCLCLCVNGMHVASDVCQYTFVGVVTK